MAARLSADLRALAAARAEDLRKTADGVRSSVQRAQSTDTSAARRVARWHINDHGYLVFDDHRTGAWYGERVLGPIRDRFHSGEMEPFTHFEVVYRYTEQSYGFNGSLRGVDMQDWFRQMAKAQEQHELLAPLLRGGPRPSLYEVVQLLARSDLSDEQRALITDLRAGREDLELIASRSARYRRFERMFDGRFEPEAFADLSSTLRNLLTEPRIPHAVHASRGLRALGHLVDGTGNPLGTDLPGPGRLRSVVDVVQVEKGAMSTALGGSPLVSGSPYPHRLELDIPEGHPGLWMGERSAYSDQRELILPPETRYRVMDMSGSRDDGFVLNAEVLPYNAVR